MLAYIVLALVTLFGCGLYMYSAIEESHNDIKNDIDYGIFENKTSFGIRSNGYSIVTYHEGKCPTFEEYKKENEFGNEESFKEQYGEINKYYLADKGWIITQYNKLGDTIYGEEIRPYAVGLNSKSSYHFEADYLFREMHSRYASSEDDNIDYDNVSKLTNLKVLKSKFHYVVVDTLKKSNDGELIWFENHSAREFMKKYYTGKFYIAMRTSKVAVYSAAIAVGALLLELLVFIVVYRFMNHGRNDDTDDDSDISNDENAPEQEGSSEGVEALLEKLNPKNFMEPFDSEKFKVATDLYTALSSARNNATIVELIRQKAKDELDIE